MEFGYGGGHGGIGGVAEVDDGLGAEQFSLAFGGGAGEELA